MRENGHHREFYAGWDTDTCLETRIRRESPFRCITLALRYTAQRSCLLLRAADDGHTHVLRKSRLSSLRDFHEWRVSKGMRCGSKCGKFLFLQVHWNSHISVSHQPHQIIAPIITARIKWHNVGKSWGLCLASSRSVHAYVCERTIHHMHPVHIWNNILSIPNEAALV